MNKRTKQVITGVLFVSLAFFASQISNNGGLQSSALMAPLSSCQNGIITSLERCSTPLTTERNRIQGQIDGIAKQIQSKKANCAKLQKNRNKAQQLKTCREQLRTLERNNTTQKNQLFTVNSTLAQLVSEIPLKSEVDRIRNQLKTTQAEIVAKTNECTIRQLQKQTSQLSLCSTQLAALQNIETLQKNAFLEAANKLKQVAGLVIQLPVRPPTPMILHCCADNKAKNDNVDCGVMPNTNPNPALCVYPTNPGCTKSEASNYDPAHDWDDGSCEFPAICQDSTALNYMQIGDCILQPQIVGCTSPAALNYIPNAVIEDGSCDFTPEMRPGCTNQDAHNFEAGANQDNGMCETCSDNKKNGDEEEIDCGGNKCSECVAGCKDPAASNYNPEAQKSDSSLCKYDEIIIDTGSFPNLYCDVPTAVNYQTHDKKDTTYQADSGVCNFCGNDTTDGTKKSDGTIEPVKFTGEISGITVEASESCDDGANDKPYDGCSACRLETCGDELALCQAYKFTGGESKSSLSDRISRGITDKPESKRPGWNNQDIDITTSRGRDFATFGFMCIRDRDKPVTKFRGIHTQFGYNDSGDGGWGTPNFGNYCDDCIVGNIPQHLKDKYNIKILKTGAYSSNPKYSQKGGVPTNNKIIRGVAVPRKMLLEMFGTDVNVRKVRVDVTAPNGQCYRYPIVDEGPNEYVWMRKCTPVLDMTWAAQNELGGQSEVNWEIKENAGVDILTLPSTVSNSTGTVITQYSDDYFLPTACN